MKESHRFLVSWYHPNYHQNSDVPDLGLGLWCTGWRYCETTDMAAMVRFCDPPMARSWTTFPWTPWTPEDEMDAEEEGIRMCMRCDAPLLERHAVAEVRLYRAGVVLPIPPEQMIHICQTCGEMNESEDDARRLDDAQAVLFQEYVASVCRGCVQIIRWRDETVTLAGIEDALGVGQGWFSLVMTGKREASLTALRLLRLCARFPDLFQVLRGEHYQSPLRPFVAHELL